MNERAVNEKQHNNNHEEVPRNPGEIVYYGSRLFNPPPRDGRCQCCGRHASEVKPYGGPGDPLVGDFSGVHFVKVFRPDALPDEETEKALSEAHEVFEKDGFASEEEWLIHKYGKEKTEEMYLMSQMANTVHKSWECRDCVVLYDEEYFEKYMANQKDRTS